jgi:hypothetical protein
MTAVASRVRPRPSPSGPARRSCLHHRNHPAASRHTGTADQRRHSAEMPSFGDGLGADEGLVVEARQLLEPRQQLFALDERDRTTGSVVARRCLSKLAEGPRPPARSTRSCAGHDHCPNSVWGVGSARPARPVLGDEGLLEGAAPDGAGGEQTAMKGEGVNGPPRASLGGAVAREGVATTVVVKVVLSRRRRITGRGYPAEDGRFCWFPNMRWAGLIQWAGV